MSDAPEIDGFSSLTLIGRGTSGTVYQARQEAMSRNVAIKVLQASTTDPHARERFAREVRTLGELSGHPSIVTTYTSGVTADDRPYLVMDLMASDISDKSPTDLAETSSMVKAAAEGLAEAHRRGVLHRDIKPANIFLDRYGRIRLGDFGLVGLSEAASITNASVGSPAYMAPELLSNAKASVSSDLYALAVTLYGLVEGSLPFEAGDSGVAGLFHTILSSPHRPPQHMGPNLTAFIDRCLAKDPDQRPQSADEFITALDDALDADEAPTSSGFPVAPVAPVATPQPGTTTSGPPQPPPAQPPPPQPGTAITSGPGATSGPGTTPGPSGPPGFGEPPPGGPPPGGGFPSSGGPPGPPGDTSGPHRTSRNRTPMVIGGIVAVIALLGGVFALTQLGGGSPVADVSSGVASVRSSGLAIPTGEEEPIDSVDSSTGFLIEGGYIVTQRAPGIAESLTVEFEGQEVDAELVGISECHAVSVLRVDETDVEGRHVFGWSDARIGFGNNLRVLGHDDGNDFEEFEVEVMAEAERSVTGFSLQDLQFEMDPDLPGPALGAPVLDRDGAVAGIVLSTNRSLDRTFAASDDEIADIVDDIIDADGDVDGIGIGFRVVGDAISVTAVRPGSSADEAGIQPGDEIIGIDEEVLNISDEPLTDYCEIVSDVGDRTMSIEVIRGDERLIGEINGTALEVVTGGGDLEFQQVTSENGQLAIEIPVTWEVFVDPGTADYPGAVLSAQGPEGFLEYSTQDGNTPQQLIDNIVLAFADEPGCSVGEPIEYVDGVFTGLEAAIVCDDQPDAVAKVIGAVEDSSGIPVALVYGYDGPAAEEFSSNVEFTFLLNQ